MVWASLQHVRWQHMAVDSSEVGPSEVGPSEQVSSGVDRAKSPLSSASLLSRLVGGSRWRPNCS